MLPTRRGLFFIGVGLVTYMLAHESNVGWFYVADAVIWALVLRNLAFPLWTVRGLRARRHLAPESGSGKDGLFEGDTVRVLLEITNSGRTPRYFFTVADRSPLEAPGQEMKYLLVGTLRPRSSVTGSYANLCHRRGEHQFGPLWLE